MLILDVFHPFLPLIPTGRGVCYNANVGEHLPSFTFASNTMPRCKGYDGFLDSSESYKLLFLLMWKAWEVHSTLFIFNS